MNPRPWTGEFVREALGVQIETDWSASLLPVEDLVGLALRNNPKRAHLLVSSVLAKHVPTDPALAMVAGELLGVLVADCLAPAKGRLDAAGRLAQGLSECLHDAGPDRSASARTLTELRQALRPWMGRHPDIAAIGYAETATGLGRLVANALGSYYIHSTRHAPEGARSYAAFEEGHSHATSHRILATDPRRLDNAPAVVLVDDELSTGSTIINTICALHAVRTHPAYVVATLVDLRTDRDRARLDDLALMLGTEISVVSLASGRIHLPEDILPAAQEILSALPAPHAVADANPGSLSFLDLGTDVIAPIRSDRFGNPSAPPDAVVAAIAKCIGERLRATGGDVPASTLILGTEELIYLPMAVAAKLAADCRTLDVKFSTTTRSPIVAISRMDYAAATAVTFISHDISEDVPGARFAYNLGSAEGTFHTIVLIPEPGTEGLALSGPGSVSEALLTLCRHVVVVLLPDSGPPPAGWTVPATPEAVPRPLRGPDFGSYAPDDVGWLLKDLGDTPLEAPAAEREHRIQSGLASYAESLPVEYIPSDEYQRLYQVALHRSARRMAEAVGIVADLAIAARN
ncbi:MAG: phosphoribosyltransferase family protein, partial [Actinomycetota bacterium]|nr:phosphoribosyltransferase family protein [Actinomycetota bacterium]